MFKTRPSHILFLGFLFFLSQFSTAQSGNFCMPEVLTNEPSLAIHPSNPALQIIGSNVDYYFWSNDTGKTWEKFRLNSPYGVYGDPVVKISQSERVYYAHLSQTPDKVYPKIFDRIVFQYSDNQGRKFNGGIAIGLNQEKMQDKPWFDCFSPNPSNRNEDIIALSWTEFDKYKSDKPNDSARIRFALSQDGGHSFSNAITVSQTQGGCMDNSQTPEGATPIILSDKSIHITWSLNEKLFYNSSFDLGKTWTGERILENHVGGWSIEKSGFMRTNVMPFLVKGKNDELILVWADNRLDTHHVFIIISKDKGKTWSKAQRVTPKKTKRKAKGDYFLPYPSVDPITGQLQIVYYFRNKDITQFTEKGISIAGIDYKKFKHYNLTEYPFLNAGKEVFFGDYSSVASTNHHIRSVWTAHSLGRVFLCSRSFLENPDNNQDIPRKPQTDLQADYRDNKRLFVYFYQKRRRNWEGKITINNQTAHSFSIKRKNRETELFEFGDLELKQGDKVIVQIRKGRMSHTVSFEVE